MTIEEATKLIHDKNNGLIEITEEQRIEILKYYTEQDMECMISPAIIHKNCFYCGPRPTTNFDN
jgi:hypothetical protein